jgi:hypothetical protein
VEIAYLWIQEDPRPILPEHSKKNSLRRLIVIFPGSICPEDWMNNLDSTCIPTSSLGIKGPILYVHQGFGKKFASFYEDLYDKITRLSAPPIDEIFFTGHSAGGALALLTAGHFAQTNLSKKILSHTTHVPSKRLKNNAIKFYGIAMPRVFHTNSCKDLAKVLPKHNGLFYLVGNNHNWHYLDWVTQMPLSYHWQQWLQKVQTYSVTHYLWKKIHEPLDHVLVTPIKSLYKKHVSYLSKIPLWAFFKEIKKELCALFLVFGRLSFCTPIPPLLKILFFILSGPIKTILSKGFLWYFEKNSTFDHWGIRAMDSLKVVLNRSPKTVMIKGPYSFITWKTLRYYTHLSGPTLPSQASNRADGPDSYPSLHPLSFNPIFLPCSVRQWNQSLDQGALWEKTSWIKKCWNTLKRSP